MATQPNNESRSKLFKLAEWCKQNLGDKFLNSIKDKRIQDSLPTELRVYVQSYWAKNNTLDGLVEALKKLMKGIWIPVHV